MNIRLGIVGPEDSVQRILKVAGTNDRLTLLPLSYERTEDTEQIVKEHAYEVDQWLFSGQAPYHFALAQGLVREDEASYPPLYGSSLLGTLLEAIYAEGRKVYSVSLDTIHHSEIESLKQTYALEELSCYTYSYSGYEPAEKIVHHHLQLFKEGKVDIAITCIQSVYQRLKENDIPCYRVVPSPLSIQLTLQFLLARGQSSWYRKSQIAILGMEVIPEGTELNQRDPYRQRKQELELNRVLLDYAEQVQGSYIRMGDGLYFIYTTRGQLEQYMVENSYQTLLNDIHVQSKLNVRLGIGYGLTALDAEQNVHIALQYTREHREAVIISVNEDKEVVKENGAELCQHRIWGDEWEKRFKEANLSPLTVSKIEALARHYQTHMVTAKELAAWLHRTERNARRILMELERLGLAVVAGEEQPGRRGRPRKIYELRLNQSDS